MSTSRSILAFVHIEKAAGTTFNHILRRNFFLRYIDVRPLSPNSNRVFQPEDMRRYLRINPFLSAISGHSIRPFSNLPKAYPNLRFVTILRDPVSRYLSQYQYLVSIGNKPNDFEKFLAEDEFTNYQTKKLADSEDAGAAIEVLNSMLEVGTVEEFEAFLLRLKKSLLPMCFDPYYRIKNITKRPSDNNQLMVHYGDEVRARNDKDQALYDYAVKELIPRRNELYGPGLEEDLKRFREENGRWWEGFKTYADYVARKFYYERVTGLIRRMRGMPSRGPY